MTAYIINQLTVTDPSYQKEYYPGVAAVLDKYEGMQIVGSPPVECLEGVWQLPERVAILEFPILQKSKTFWNDPVYEPFKKARQSGAIGKVMLVDGVK